MTSLAIRLIAAIIPAMLDRSARNSMCAVAALGLVVLMAAQEKACPWLWVECVDPAAAAKSDPSSSDHKKPALPTIGMALETAVPARVASPADPLRPGVLFETPMGMLKRVSIQNAIHEIMPALVAALLAPVPEAQFALPERNAENAPSVCPRIDPSIGSSIIALAPPLV